VDARRAQEHTIVINPYSQGRQPCPAFQEDRL